MRKNKMLITVVALTILLSLLPVVVRAQTGTPGTKAPGVWVSSINIQNTGTRTATVVLDFYNANGTRVLSFTPDQPIPAGGSRSFYVPTQIPGLADGQYSVIVSSDQPLQVVVNSSSTTPYTAGAYSGIQATEVGRTLYFPGLYKNYYGFFSQVVLQNTESVDASVTLHFYNQRTGANVATISGTIPATSSRVFALQDLPAVPSGNVNGLLSLRVTSDRNLAGIANIWTAAYRGEYSDYNAYVSGSTAVYAPALYKHYYNFVSSLTVQNLESDRNAEILITYSNGVTETKTLLPFQGFEYYQPADPRLPSGNVAGVFSAKIESTNGANIAVLVNVEDKHKGLLASYNGPSQATTAVNCPVVLKEFYNWFSAQTVQNVGTAPTDITITYATTPVVSRTFQNVPPNGTVNIIELAAAGSVLPSRSSVSAVITSTGQPIVAVVQEDSKERYTANPGDYLLAYTCVAR